MKKILALFAIGLFMTGNLLAEIKRSDILIAGIMSGITIADYQSSKGLLELNPILGQNRIHQGMIMGVSTIGVWGLQRRLGKSPKTKDKVLRWVIVGGFVGIHGCAIIHNFVQK